MWQARFDNIVKPCCGEWTFGNIAGGPLPFIPLPVMDRQPFGQKVPPAGGIGVRGVPLQAHFDIKMLCLPSKGPPDMG